MPRSLTLAAFICLLMLLACKKGKDDPAVSLLSRKARMAGSWHLTGAHLKIDEEFKDSASVVEFDFVQSKLSFTVTEQGTSTAYYTEYKLDLNMDKEGNFNFSEMLSNRSLNASGRWSFNSGVGDSKKKADVYYILEKVEKGATNDVLLFNRTNTNFEYFIRELRNKKLVLETSSYMYADVNGDFQGMQGYFIFEQ